MFDFKNLNIRLLGVNLVIFITAFLFNDPFHFFESSYETAESLIKFKNVTDIDQINISHPGKKMVELNKTDKGWILHDSQTKEEYIADTSKINKSLERLLKSRKYYEVTDNPDKYNEFEVGDNALKLELKNKDKTVTLLIGKPGSSYNTSIVKLANDKTVYSVRGNFSSDWNQEMDYFRNKRLFSFTRDNIKLISANGPQNFDIENGEKNDWYLLHGTSKVPTNITKVNRLLDDISLIEGNAFYHTNNLGNRYGTINVMLKSNVSFSLQINRVGKDYIIKSDTNPYWQTISDYRVESLFPKVNELKSEANQKK